MGKRCDIPCLSGLVRTIFRHMISFLANLTSSWLSWLLSLLGAVSNSMTDLVTQSTLDLDTLNFDELIGTLSLGVAEDTTVVTLGNTSIDGDTSIREALDVLFGGFRPDVDHDRTLRLLGVLIGDGVLLANFALQCDDCMSFFHVWLLGSYQVDLEVAAAELLLDLEVCHLLVSFGKDLDAFFDIIEVSLVGSLFE